MHACRSTLEDPTWAIIAVAKRVGADMIVVGAHGHSRVSRFLGSVSQQVIGHAPCTVRVARAPRLLDALAPKVLLAVDKSREGFGVIDAALKRSWMSVTQARVVVVGPRCKGEKALALDRFATREVRRCAAAGLSVSKSVRQGTVVKNILDDAAKWNATSILMGARELDPVRRLLISSTSLAVAARARCSVEVMRKPGDAASRRFYGSQ